MNTKHTPGPWIVAFEATEVSGVNVRFDVSSEHRISICTGQSQEHLGDGINEDECRANARLIAAAPELLQALQMVARSSFMPTVGTTREAIEAAIAEATGSNQ
jgi:hypothetical protein